MKADIADIKVFLRQFDIEDLAGRGILRTKNNFLQSASAKPLLELMYEHGITRLEDKERGWYLTSDGDFANPSAAKLKIGKFEDLDKPGGIFDYQNIYINPFFEQISQGSIHVGTEKVSFGLERDLQNALRGNIAQLDPGLRITDGGSEKTVDAGRIDITAEDGEGNIVVIELKAGTAQSDAITQLLAYMGTIENPDGKLVRGILVANDFAPRVVQAARAVPGISLKAYSFQFSFQER